MTKQNKTSQCQNQKTVKRWKSLLSPSLTDTDQRPNQQCDDSIDMDKVERIRQSIARGDMEINSERLAQKIIDVEKYLFDARNKNED